MTTHRLSIASRAFGSVSLAAALAVCACSPALAAEPVTIAVQADRQGHRISPTLYGIFFEDINYGADGGLYAELVQNRSFEFYGKDALFAWSKVEQGGGALKLSVASDGALNANNPHFARLEVQSIGQGAGVANSGWGGIPVKRGEKYPFSVYARSASGGSLMVRLESAAGKALDFCTVGPMTGDWRKFSATLTASATDANARLVVLAPAAGTMDLDMVSLFPEKTFKGRPNGLRADLAEKLAELKPGFMRFPGGCIVEGKNLANRYIWKDTIGDVAQRKQNWNRWQDAVDVKAPQYYQSYGLGFFEFFQLCEDIECEPLPVLGCGMSCQFQDKEFVPVDQLGPYIQDALDLIEFANGPADSPWGAKRAEMGHPAPFNLKFIGIGNEQWDQPYFDRYPAFQKALREKHPEIKIISSAGPSASGSSFDFAWPKLRELKADIVDEHYYMPPAWFLNNSHRYDNYPRTGPKVFAGEYAAHTAGWGGNNRCNLFAALSEASFITGLERNSDVVVMASYAPLFAKIGNVQWPVDLIWFNNTSVYGSPSYYVQKLFSRNRGDVTLPTQVTDKRPPAPPAGRVGVGTYHTEAEFKDVRVTAKDGRALLSADFSKGYGDWKPDGGKWSVRDGAYHQADAKNFSTSFAGEQTWANYTLALKARKISGDEGFIIAVRNAGGNQVQWNLGGWGNKQHGIQVMADGKETILERVPGAIETGRWYDIKVALNGTKLECFLDGKLVQSADVPAPATPKIFATASRDEKSGELILKVVNPTGEATDANLQLSGATKIAATADMTVLSSPVGTDENSLSAPEKVVPVTKKLAGIKPEFRHTFPPWSMTVLRIGDGR